MAASETNFENASFSCLTKFFRNFVSCNHTYFSCKNLWIYEQTHGVWESHKKSHSIQKTDLSKPWKFNFHFFSTRWIKRSFAKHPELQKWARPTFQMLTKVKVTLKAVWNSNFQHLIQREILMMCKLNFSGLWNIKGNLENLQSLANPFNGIRHGSIFKLS